MENKYKKGKPYTDIQSLVNDLSKEKYVFFVNKPKHPSIMKNMTLKTIMLFIKSKMLCEADINRPNQHKIRIKAVRKNSENQYKKRIKAVRKNII